MTWDSVYLVCFAIGLGLCLLSALGGFGHLHLGLLHRGLRAAPTGSAGHFGRVLAGLNSFTILAFLTWFGGAGYLLERYSILISPLIFAAALLSGCLGAFILWTAFFKVLLPRERVLTTKDTEMAGVIARVGGPIREGDGIGEIIFSQTGGRRSSAARSEDGAHIERGAEVVVVRYERGIAYVRRWDDVT